MHTCVKHSAVLEIGMSLHICRICRFSWLHLLGQPDSAGLTPPHCCASGSCKGREPGSFGTHLAPFEGCLEALVQM